MTGMFQSLDLFVLSCLLLSVESQAGQILPPQNVSVLWINDFQPQLSWAPPMQSVENCKYEVASRNSDEDSTEIYSLETSPWLSTYTVMEGGFLTLTVETICVGIHSEQVVININYPELVSNLQCYIQSSKHSHCSWIPASHTPDLRFFYWLGNEVQSEPVDSNSSLPLLQECSSYNYIDGVRTGCDLQAKITQAIHILFNGTWNNMLVRNTFKKQFKDDVRPLPLNWTVTKTGDKFLINWTIPDIPNLLDWIFKINYTECKEPKFKQEDDKTSTYLDLVSHCPYRMAIKAEVRGKSAETPWSDEKYFDADTGPNTLVYAAIIIPLLFAGLAALTLVCCRKNKENIFPRVPEPRDLLSDISDNNNKITVCKLYVPQEEEDNCKITLVIDPQSNHIWKH